MPRALRTTTFVLVMALAGCAAGTSFHGLVEFGQWTPDMEVSSSTAGGSAFNLISQGGLPSSESFWAIDSSIRLTRASNKVVGAYAFNLGYFDYTGSGDGTLTALAYGGSTLDGATHTKADLRLFKFSYEEPSTGGSGSERTGGLIGLHYLTYDISATDAAADTGTFADTAPMFVIGYKVSYYSNQLMYFFTIEWMDLNAFTLKHVQGDVLDTTAGIRWVFDDSQQMAISAGYRLYQANLDIRGDTLNIDMDGAFLSFFFAW